MGGLVRIRAVARQRGRLLHGFRGRGRGNDWRHHTRPPLRRCDVAIPFWLGVLKRQAAMGWLSTMVKPEVATLAGGCFWCLEAAFQDLKGVEKVQSGYSGGRVANPSYEDVCTGTTGHAEVVQITFDPTVVSFDDL